MRNLTFSKAKTIRKESFSNQNCWENNFHFQGNNALFSWKVEMVFEKHFMVLKFSRIDEI